MSTLSGLFGCCTVEGAPMRWRKRDMWKAGIAIAGMLLLMVFKVWVPVSAAGAQERVSGFTGTVTATVQATPTVDATVTALNKEKLAQEVQKLKNQNEPDLLGWLRTNAAVFVVVIGGLIGLFRWFGDRRSEREKRDEDRFQAVVADLGSNNIEARVGAAIMLCTFLQPGYERFYRQSFDLAVAHLRLRKPDLEIKDDPEAPVLASLNQALIVVFKAAFPRTREWVKQGSPSSRLQRLKARLKRILRSEKPFEPQYLDASRIRLDNAFLVPSDLERIWMREAFLKGTHLNGDNLNRANLRRADLSGAWLSAAHLNGADLSWANLNGTDLTKADLTEAHLLGADLCKTYLEGVNLSGADLRGVDLSENDRLSGIKLRGAKYNKGMMYERTHGIKPTQWPQGFDPKIAGLICVDC